MTVIESGRLRLRPLTVADAEVFAALHDDPRVSEYIGPYTPEQARERLARVEADWRDRGHGFCAVELKATGEFLGRAGLQYWEHFDEVEAGWVLRPDVWGHGYATEAAGTCVDWGFSTLDVPYITAMIRPGNTPSERVAERLGFAPLRKDETDGRTVTVYAKQRP